MARWFPGYLSTWPAMLAAVVLAVDDCATSTGDATGGSKGCQRELNGISLYQRYSILGKTNVSEEETEATVTPDEASVVDEEVAQIGITDITEVADDMPLSSLSSSNEDQSSNNIDMSANRTAAGASLVTKHMQRVSLMELDPLAVCNDGSPAAYYVKLSDTRSTLWIINLEGGSWCYSAESCAARCPLGSMNHFCTSKGQKPQQPLPSGSFQPQHHPDLADANKVFLPSCTSDAFMGDGFAFGRHFRGARVVQAVLSDLRHRFGLGRSTATRGIETVMWSGQSAGARGAMVHLDYVKSVLEREVRGGVEVVGFLDSPLWIDMPPYNSSEFLGFAAECRSVYSNFGVRQLGTDCSAVHGGSPDTAWKCIMGEHRLPFVKTPYLVVASQYDAFQLRKNYIWPKNTPSLKRVYASELARRTAIAMRALRATWPPNAAKQNAVFSWSCYEHATSLVRVGFDYQTCGGNGITLGAAFRQFLEQKPFAMKKTDLMWVETCEGLACGTGC